MLDPLQNRKVSPKEEKINFQLSNSSPNTGSADGLQNMINAMRLPFPVNNQQGVNPEIKSIDSKIAALDSRFEDILQTAPKTFFSGYYGQDWLFGGGELRKARHERIKKQLEPILSELNALKARKAELERQNGIAPQSNEKDSTYLVWQKFASKYGNDSTDGPDGFSSILNDWR